jgi:hypothetical protein
LIGKSKKSGKFPNHEMDNVATGEARGGKAYRIRSRIVFYG